MYSMLCGRYVSVHLVSIAFLATFGSVLIPILDLRRRTTYDSDMLAYERVFKRWIAQKNGECISHYDFKENAFAVFHFGGNDRDLCKIWDREAVS